MTETVNDERLVDLRDEVPQRRYDIVFDSFTELAPGASYVLVSDQHTKPLHYQFAAEYSGHYTWQYLERGPELWRVRIGRRATASS